MKPNQLFRREPFIEMVQHTAEEQLSLVHVYLYSTLFRDDSGFQLEIRLCSQLNSCFVDGRQRTI